MKDKIKQIITTLGAGIQQKNVQIVKNALREYMALPEEVGNLAENELQELSSGITLSNFHSLNHGNLLHMLCEDSLITGALSFNEIINGKFSKLVSFFIECGVDPKIKNRDGKRPLDYMLNNLRITFTSEMRQQLTQLFVPKVSKIVTISKNGKKLITYSKSNDDDAIEEYKKIEKEINQWELYFDKIISKGCFNDALGDWKSIYYCVLGYLQKTIKGEKNNFILFLIYDNLNDLQGVAIGIERWNYATVDFHIGNMLAAPWNLQGRAYEPQYYIQIKWKVGDRYKFTGTHLLTAIVDYANKDEGIDRITVVPGFKMSRVARFYYKRLFTEVRVDRDFLELPRHKFAEYLQKFTSLNMQYTESAVQSANIIQQAAKKYLDRKRLKKS